MDFGGTRKIKGSSERHNPHVHALALAPPQIRFKYQVLLADQLGHDRQLNSIESVIVKQYDPTKASVFSLTTYCMKGLAGLPEEKAQWLERSFPG